MVEAEGNPLASVAPDWIPLADAEAELTRRFKISAKGIISDLVTAIRAAQIPHRVAGLHFDDLRQEKYSGRYSDPPGLDWDGTHVRVANWDDAKMDWRSGTVEGTWGRDERRKRLRIELYWPKVEAWAEMPLTRLREMQNATERLGIATDDETRHQRFEPGRAAAGPVRARFAGSGVDSPWSAAVGAWVPLADLLVTIERELAIAPDDATNALREPLECYGIHTQIVGWNPIAASGQSIRRDWAAQGQPGNPHPYCVSAAGWRHVDWGAGTLAGRQVEVRWAHVKDHLATLAAKARREAAATASILPAEAPTERKSARGRPPRHNWDSFWIEVAIYAAANDLDEMHRSELQTLMVKWAAEHSVDPPDDATIRNKLATLYAAARKRV
jgi:hypothetical protein